VNERATNKGATDRGATDSDAVVPHPIAITGMHRSGTSMITRGLHQAGLHLIGGDADALLDAADDNPEGFWENKAIVTCNDDLLEAVGGAWDNPPALLPQAVDDPRVAAVVEPATTALAGLRENERWGFKDPRLCLTAAFWLDLQPDLRFVICVRNPLEVALSLKRRNQNSYSLGLSLWERYYESILDLVPADRRIITHYDSYFLDPDGELRRVCDFAALEPAELTVRRELRHHDVGVSLDEANLSGGIRALYRRLCDEAGVALAPPAVVDEGQVRRLVLDGTVAARHAEQRQRAIDRLEERLAEVRGSEGELRSELARVRRESESRRADLSRREHDLQQVRAELDRLRGDTNARVDGLIAGQERSLAKLGEMTEQNRKLMEQNRRVIDTADTIAEMTAGLRATSRQLVEANTWTHERLAHNEAITNAIHVKLRAVEDEVRSGFLTTLGRRARRLLGGGVRRAAGPTRRVARAGARRGVPVAKRSAKATAKRLPAPVQHRLRRVRRAVVDGQAAKRVKERADRMVDRLPGPAGTMARKGTSVVRRSGAVPKATRVARGVGRRLPDPAKKMIRKVVPKSPAPAARPARAAKKAAPAPRPKQTSDGRAAQVPKGPAAFKWQKGYERLVSEFVGEETKWAVITPGSKIEVGKVGGRRATTFPSVGGEAPAADSLSLVAILEALRVAGNERLVLPEGSRLWFRQHPELRDHVARNHATVVDREAAGAVFDLTSGAAVERKGLLAEVNELCADLESTPAVLDWTGLDISGELPGFTTFQPPTPESLPYFDQSVEIVVTTADHDRVEAARVASVGVITVSASGTKLTVVDTSSNGGESADHSVDVWAPETDDARLEKALVARVGECGATLRFGEPSEIGNDADVVVMLDPGVLPLPGAITAAVSAVLDRPDSVAVAKVIDSHGRIECAGGTVFADGSAAGIAAGTLEVRAPWHEFVRPVCWGRGLIAASAAQLTDVPPRSDGDVVAWCGELWSAGIPVVYRPKAAVVRTGGSGPTPSRAAGVWPSMLGSRPRRPDTLGDGVWRYLLANDDPGALAGPRER
jgi:Sulfotransferase family